MSRTSEPAKIIKPAKVEQSPEAEHEAVAVDVEGKIEKASVEDENALKQPENENAATPAVPPEPEGKNKDDLSGSSDSIGDKSVPEPVSGDQKKAMEQKENTAQQGGDESMEEDSNHAKRKKRRRKPPLPRSSGWRIPWFWKI